MRRAGSFSNYSILKIVNEYFKHIILLKYKEKRMVMFSSIFNIDGPLMRTLSRIADLVVLNILWMLFSLPIVTIGPSCVALYYVILKMHKNEENNVAKMFIKEFRQDFLKKLIAGLIIIVAGVILFADVHVVTKFMNGADGIAANGLTNMALKVFMGILVIIYTFMASLTFPLMAQFDNTVKQTIINSILIGVRFIYLVIPAAIILCAPVILFIFRTDIFVKTFMIWIMLGGSGLAFISTYFYKICFKHYIKDV